MSEQTVEFESGRSFHKLYCENPENLKLVEESFGISVIARGNVLKMVGSETRSDNAKLFEMLQLDEIRNGYQKIRFHKISR